MVSYNYPDDHLQSLPSSLPYEIKKQTSQYLKKLFIQLLVPYLFLILSSYLVFHNNCGITLEYPASEKTLCSKWLLVRVRVRVRGLGLELEL